MRRLLQARKANSLKKEEPIMTNNKKHIQPDQSGDERSVETPVASQKNSRIEEIKKLLTFLSTLYGLLAGISVLFPFADQFVNFFPLHPALPENYATSSLPFFKGLFVISPEGVRICGTIFALWIVLWTFSKRNQLDRNQAKWSFFCAVIPLIGFFVIWALVPSLYFSYFVVDGGISATRFSGIVVNDILLLISYATTMGMLTRGFMILGMLEYYRKQ